MGEMVQFREAGLRARPQPGGAIVTMDLATDDGKRQLYRAFTGSDGLAKREIGKSLSIVHVMAHIVNRVDDETGESKEGLRCVYLCSDGRRITSSSYPLWDSLCTLATVFGIKAPFEPPLVVVVRSAPTQKAGQDYLYFDLP